MRLTSTIGKTNLVLGVSFLVLAVGGLAAYEVAGPDREACKAAISHRFDAFTAEEIRDMGRETFLRQVRWPCRFQSEEQINAIGDELSMEQLGK